jgi:TRAP-type mannitol/chloroaromatic compound transport system permease small subunit
LAVVAFDSRDLVGNLFLTGTFFSKQLLITISQSLLLGLLILRRLFVLAFFVLELPQLDVFLELVVFVSLAFEAGDISPESGNLCLFLFRLFLALGDFVRLFFDSALELLDLINLISGHSDG